ncbi:MAG: efflux RND transporter periplasmic adaptor subunit [Polaromonas sp.]|jgi:cobalt-zinc-cadmium efflux system membrane fusion protein|uniref:efflux RND transporter periplasmic adaptor subunit n=1 Tax=Polaromonas sp. TaxID=1869339 RepID=UPI002489A2C5|nr:HlyD family efflux transporter periplasmic adaptor subunit [Polaromonas sp.]MDI1268052.1 efflux RND transporter periplasmic adaptor subunit [Polaromonas sp.]
MNAIFKPNRPLSLVHKALAAIIFIAFSVFAPAWAAGDHGAEAPAAASAVTSPRINSHSELFELVGVVDNGEMKIYLDRYASNEPVTDAKIEVEAGTAKGAATPQADGSYSFKHELLAQPGTLSVSFVVAAGKDTDLLAGDLVITDPHADDDHAGETRPWLRWAAYVGAALLLVALAAVAWRMRRRTGFAGLMAAGLLALGTAAPWDAQAGPGHDHGGEATPAAGGNAPQRLGDGGVFLPKASQRQLGVRTLVAEEASLPTTVELTGRVVLDSNAGGKVQPTQAGRIEAGPRGLPQLGQAVRKGEVLALVRASSNAIERANQQAQSAELNASLTLAVRRVERLQQLEGTVPQKDIEAARSDVTSLQQRAAAVAGSVSATESLRAPVSGVIAAASVVAGQVVNAGDLLFEIVDPTRMSVEANAFDAALSGNIASASASAAPGTSVPLQFVGAGNSLREGAIPLVFRTVPGKTALLLSINQPVKVTVQTKSQVKGFAVPTSAVVKNASNQDMVWVHTGAELFAPRTVRQLPLDGSTVAIVDGLKAGDRVVTQGAPLVNQVR